MDIVPKEARLRHDLQSMQEDLIRLWEDRRHEMKLLDAQMDSLFAQIAQIEEKILALAYPEVDVKKCLKALPYPK